MHAKNFKLAIPAAAVLAAAAVVGGPALASSNAPTAGKAHTAKTVRGPRGPKGARGPRGLPGPQGPQGPAGPSGSNGSNGANGSNGTAGGGGAEGTILYAANAFAGTPIPNVPASAAPATTIYAGHGLTFTATCTGTASAGVLTLAGTTTANNAINVDGVLQPVPAPVAPATTVPITISSAPGAAHNVLFASTDGAVVDLHFATSTQQPGANCFAFGTRLGG